MITESSAAAEERPTPAGVTQVARTQVKVDTIGHATVDQFLEFVDQVRSCFSEDRTERWIYRYEKMEAPYERREKGAKGAAVRAPTSAASERHQWKKDDAFLTVEYEVKCESWDELKSFLDQREDVKFLRHLELHITDAEREFKLLFGDTKGSNKWKSRKVRIATREPAETLQLARVKHKLGKMQYAAHKRFDTRLNWLIFLLLGIGGVTYGNIERVSKDGLTSSELVSKVIPTGLLGFLCAICTAWILIARARALTARD